jgi:hypothetical protein
MTEDGCNGSEATAIDFWMANDFQRIGSSHGFACQM